LGRALLTRQVLVIPTRIERRALLRALPGLVPLPGWAAPAWRADKLLALECGMGPERAAALLPALERAAPAALWLVGWCGGLCDELRVGDVVLADATLSGTGADEVRIDHPPPQELIDWLGTWARSQGRAHRNVAHRNVAHRSGAHRNVEYWNAPHQNAAYKSAGHEDTAHRNAGRQDTARRSAAHRSAAHSGAAQQGRRLVVGPVLTSPRVLERAAEKRAAGAGGAAAVEMEAAPLAHWAAERGVPFRHVRVVLDPMSSDLPPEELHGHDALGEESGGYGWRAIWRPRTWPAVWRLMRQVWRARRILASLGEALTGPGGPLEVGR
jgi:nucleoside phosphorylase